MYSAILLAAQLFVGAASPTPKDTKPETPAATERAAPAPKPWWSPFGLTVGLETVVGIGSFVTDENTDAPYWASTLSLSPSWELEENLSTGLSLSMSYELTSLFSPCGPADGPRPSGAPQEDCADTDDPAGRRFDLSDLELYLNHDQLLEYEKAKLGGWFSIALPTSRFSQAASNLFTLAIGTRVSRSFGPVTPSLRLSAAKFFPTEDAPTLDATEVLAQGTPIGHCSAERTINCVPLSGFVSNWRMSVGTGVDFKVPPVPGLGFGIGFSYTYSRRFGREPDELSSTVTDVDGRRIVDGVSESDTISGSLSASYEYGDHWSASLGVATVQPVLTADGRSVRFPFYDFISPANNYTGWFLAVAYSL